MRILLATYLIQPHIGGVGNYIFELKKELERRGHQVDVFAQHPDGDKYHLVGDDWFIETKAIKDIVRKNIKNTYRQDFNLDNHHIYDFEIARYVLELSAACLRLKKYDLIHAQDIISSRALWRVKPKQVPLVATIHGCLTDGYLVAGFYRKGGRTWHYDVTQEYFGTVSSDHTIVPTKWLKNLFIDELSVPEEHMSVIPNGMDIDLFHERTEMNTDIVRPEGKTVLIFPARMDFWKGPHVLLDALAKLKRKSNDWICWLAGDGYFRSKIEQMIREYEIGEHVVTLGARTDVPALLRLADICVHPSIQENHPYSIMEAQIAGKACVVSDAGGLPEMVVSGETGLVTPTGDSHKLCEAIYSLISDKSLQVSLGDNARKWGLRNWSHARMFNEVWAVYESILY